MSNLLSEMNGCLKQSGASGSRVDADETENELALLVPLAQKYLSAGATVKKKLEAGGVQLVRAHFYSPVPTVKEIEASWESRNEAMPYLEPELYDNDFMLEFLEARLAPYVEEFNPPLDVTDNPAEYFWNNGQFGHSDALAYYCMIRYLKPKRIIEIGAGYSSLIASQALQANGSGDLILIEPFPSERLEIALDRKLVSPQPTVYQKPVQDMPVSFFAERLEKNDILFIDSTHTVKAGGDCVYIYLKIIPKIGNGVVVHVHDIFLPQMMPEHWLKELHLYWCEQYLLQAYLLENPKVRVLFGTHYHYCVNRQRLDSFMSGKCQSMGASFWFRKS
jgi:predicted O-methyltransferase YrrM